MPIHLTKSYYKPLTNRGLTGIIFLSPTNFHPTHTGEAHIINPIPNHPTPRVRLTLANQNGPQHTGNLISSKW